MDTNTDDLVTDDSGRGEDLPAWIVQEPAEPEPAEPESPEDRKARRKQNIKEIALVLAICMAVLRLLLWAQSGWPWEDRQVVITLPPTCPSGAPADINGSCDRPWQRQRPGVPPAEMRACPGQDIAVCRETVIPPTSGPPR